ICTATATADIYTLSLHDALPISRTRRIPAEREGPGGRDGCRQCGLENRSRNRQPTPFPPNLPAVGPGQLRASQQCRGSPIPAKGDQWAGGDKQSDAEARCTFLSECTV